MLFVSATYLFLKKSWFADEKHIRLLAASGNIN